MDAAVENLRERGLAEGSIGVVGTIPFQQYASIRGALPQAALVDFTAQMQQFRFIKSDEEIEFLLKGAELSDRAMEALEREGYWLKAEASEARRAAEQSRIGR